MPPYAPDGKVVDPHLWWNCRDEVAMALTKEGEAIMVDQYRHPLRESMLN